jgi:cyanate permease
VVNQQTLGAVLVVALLVMIWLGIGGRFALAATGVLVGFTAAKTGGHISSFASTGDHLLSAVGGFIIGLF